MYGVFIIDTNNENERGTVRKKVLVSGKLQYNKYVISKLLPGAEYKSTEVRWSNLPGEVSKFNRRATSQTLTRSLRQGSGQECF